MSGPYEDRPSGKLRAVTKADDDLPDGLTRGLYIGGAGNLSVMDATGTIVTITGALAGSVLPLKVKQVRDATTATSIVALY
jgi:hypothetical protein